MPLCSSPLCSSWLSGGGMTRPCATLYLMECIYKNVFMEWNQIDTQTNLMRPYRRKTAHCGGSVSQASEKPLTCSDYKKKNLKGQEADSVMDHDVSRKHFWQGMLGTVMKEWTHGLGWEGGATEWIQMKSWGLVGGSVHTHVSHGVETGIHWQWQDL